MAINVISRIQVRSGFNENLPQLAKGEFGWSIDTQQLYIGNGTVVDGAPAAGVTEILTKSSGGSIFSSGNYTFIGEAAGYTAVTGSSGNSPVLLPLQSILDEGYISVKKFGAKGDGVADDTAAINRALFQLYCRAVTPQVRRILYFPAGVYNVTGTVIKIPPYCAMVGDGMDATIIRQIDEGQTLVAQFSDGLQQVGGSYGNNGAVLSQYVTVSNLSFEHQYGSNILSANGSANVRFTRVKFNGGVFQPAVPASGATAVTLTGTPSIPSTNWIFDNCIFTKITFGFVANDDSRDISFLACSFKELYKGIKLGEPGLNAGAITGPRAYRIAFCDFDKIANYGVQVENGQKILTDGNYFRDVGNANNGIDNPISENIRFFGTECVSRDDFFDRTPDQAVQKAWIIYRPTSTVTTGVNGSVSSSSGFNRTLYNNTLTISPASLKLSIPITATTGFEMPYSIVRGNLARQGVLRASKTSVSDEFTDSAGTVGVRLSVQLTDGYWQVYYSMDNQGLDAIMYAQYRYFS